MRTSRSTTQTRCEVDEDAAGSTFAEFMEMIRALKHASPAMTVILGGDSDPANMREALPHADGIRVGRAPKTSLALTAPIARRQAEAYMEAVRRALGRFRP